MRFEAADTGRRFRRARNRFPAGCCFLAGLLSLTPPAVAGNLSADHLALLYNSRSRTSRELAEYYAAKRNLPPGRLLGLDLPITETLPRSTYEEVFIPQVRAALNGRWKEQPIRCFVTFYDVPIRVGNRRPSRLEKNLADQARTLRRASTDELRTLLRKIETLGSTEPSPHPPGPQSSADQLPESYKAAKQTAQRRIQTLEPDLRPAANNTLLELLEQAEGAAGVLGMIRLKANADKRARDRFQLLMTQATQTQTVIHEQLRQPPSKTQRQEVWKRIRHFKGLVGLVTFLAEDRAVLLGDETQASLDSELSLIAWKNYPHYRWVINLHNFRYVRDVQLRKAIPPENWEVPLYLVARLDGPSPEVVRRMIDDALAVEKKGLRGNVYIDARGYDKNDGYLLYDRNLIQLAKLLNARTALSVTLDENEAVFSAGQCPETSLYVGWYSHRKYVDAFSFAPGAVAFHAASSEAISLRDPTKQYWCKSLLADGAAVTLGPVNEPYLAAFPMPKPFFGLLLTGRYSLVECFYYCKNFNSWMMLLLGDPLYRPFAADPHLAVDDVIPAEFLPLADLTAAPATSP